MNTSAMVRIQSLPFSRISPVTISAKIHPTDQTSTTREGEGERERECIFRQTSIHAYIIRNENVISDIHLQLELLAKNLHNSLDIPLLILASSMIISCRCMKKSGSKGGGGGEEPARIYQMHVRDVGVHVSHHITVYSLLQRDIMFNCTINHVLHYSKPIMYAM